MNPLSWLGLSTRAQVKESIGEALGEFMAALESEAAWKEIWKDDPNHHAIDVDEAFRVIYRAGTSGPTTLDIATDRTTYLNQCLTAYFRNANGRSAINSPMDMILGRELGFKVEDELVQQFLNDFWDNGDLSPADNNKMGILHRRIILQLLVLGEAPLILYPSLRKDAVTKVRLIERPDEIEIAYKDNDVAVPEAYQRTYQKRDSGEEQKTTYAPFFNERAWRSGKPVMMHMAINTYQGRGRSILEPILEELTLFKNFRKDRAFMQKVASTIWAVWKRKLDFAGGKTGAKLPTKFPKAASIMTIGADDTFEIPDKHLDSHGAAEDARQFALSIAAGVAQPEYAISADASNANYASTTVATSPATRHAEALQQEIGCLFKELFRFAIRVGMQAGAISPKVTVPNPNADSADMRKGDKDTGNKPRATKPSTITVDAHRIPITLVWPDTEKSDPLDRAKALQIFDACSLATRDTLSEQAGFATGEAAQRSQDDLDAGGAFADYDKGKEPEKPEEEPGKEPKEKP